MKCQHCEKPATFHITELTGTQPVEHHLCEVHAKLYLMHQPGQSPGEPTLSGALSQQLNVADAAAEMAKIDARTCPVCGISFQEFRNQGRLGCPHDYVFFEHELEPLVVNIQGALEHKGKRPSRSGETGTDQQTELIRLRREMQSAVTEEDYERASQLRDSIRELEKKTRPEEHK